MSCLLVAVTLLQHNSCLPVVVCLLVCLPATAGCGHQVPVSQGFHLLSSGVEQRTFAFCVPRVYVRDNLV